MEVLHKRDQEMSEFMEKFDQAKKEALAGRSSTKCTIVALLEHISRGLESEQSASSQEGAKVGLDPVMASRRLGRQWNTLSDVRHHTVCECGR